MKTTLTIRPAARGGKYLGHDAANTDNQSALVLLLDPNTGERIDHAYAIASDKAAAGPENLMEPVGRAEPYAVDGQSVKVEFELDIDAPTNLRVLVFGPLKHPEQARAAQADITLLPGIDVGSAANPEGVVIEVPGLCISNVSAIWRGAQLRCTAEVTMMCGCEIADKPNWPWPPSAFSVEMVTVMKSGETHRYPLAFDSSSSVPSSFAGAWPSQAGEGEEVEAVWLYAYEPKLGNQGKYGIYGSGEVVIVDEVREVITTSNHPAP